MDWVVRGKGEEVVDDTDLADARCNLGGRCYLVLAVELGYPLVVGA
jgi:hypothetical protein